MSGWFLGFLRPEGYQSVQGHKVDIVFSVWRSSTTETLPITENGLNPGLEQSIAGQRIVSPTEHHRADAVRDIIHQSACVRPKLEC